MRGVWFLCAGRFKAGTGMSVTVVHAGEDVMKGKNVAMRVYIALLIACAGLAAAAQADLCPPSSVHSRGGIQAFG
ncbi:MAG: hypothetical protein A2Y77_01810 [Planctomycetes bacterium RBG_13_62_9]|nr:MAG: hypothetical protein A2Y77_01810 [Planctomycetes bacterium RBG_13_62_9]